MIECKLRPGPHKLGGSEGKWGLGLASAVEAVVGTGVSLAHTVFGSLSIPVWVPVCMRVWVVSGASLSTSPALRSGLRERACYGLGCIRFILWLRFCCAICFFSIHLHLINLTVEAGSDSTPVPDNSVSSLGASLPFCFLWTSLLPPAARSSGHLLLASCLQQPAAADTFC